MLLLPIVSGSLRCFGMVRTHRFIDLCSRNERRHGDEASVSRAQRLAEMAEIAGRHAPTPATCLRQSLVVYFLLRRQGLNPRILIGVKKPAADFGAHAWVELQGTALGRGAKDHAPFERSDWAAFAAR
jgi:hypothetical protein